METRNKIRVLVVDDSAVVRQSLASIISTDAALELMGTASDPYVAAKKMLDEVPDVITLDVEMPRMDGFTLARQIKQVNDQIPLIFLTAKSMKEDAIKGLKLGADDYITKPFSMKEVVARIKANIRREKYKDPEEEKKSKIVQYGNLKIDFNKLEVFRDGMSIDLTHREFELIKFLVLNPDKVFDREHLLKVVWGYEYGDLRTVDVTVRRLREKIETIDDKYIITKRGVGYYFRRI